MKLSSEIILAEYILNNDREHLDYKTHCDENDLQPFNLKHREPTHIFEHAAKVLIDNAYDLEGWQYK